jgi:CheY-like chemotaxis protein
MARITVVNDNPEFLELMHDILEGERHDTVLIDGDRPTALDEIRASDPDMLIIDIRLGVEGDHGWEIAQAVRETPSLARLPVLLCCTDPHALKELEDQIAAAQRVETLPKPFSLEELNEAIDRLLGQNAAR